MMAMRLLGEARRKVAGRVLRRVTRRALRDWRLRGRARDGRCFERFVFLVLWAGFFNSMDRICVAEHGRGDILVNGEDGLHL